ncbi:MAG TPA: hypothetical protein DCP51_08470 [Clostridiales bacterium]|nr:hypothetical protein [Clostridiales bacterium]
MLSKKFILFVLALLILITPAFTSCKETIEEESSVQTNSDVSSDENVFPLEVKKFDTTITILCVETGRHIYGELQFVPNEEKEGNVINDAVKTRNDKIEQEYGIKIEVVATKYPGDDIKNSISSGLDNYQIVNDAVYKMLPNATSNYYKSLESDLKLNSPWWDQNAIDNLSITDKTYFVAGDALITDDDNTYLILYNKTMYNENGELFGKHGDIYDFVRNGKWTIDSMYEMAKVVSKPDENGLWSTEGGTYGLLGEAYGTGILVSGAGITSAEKTSDGGMQLMVDSEKSVNSFNKVFSMMTDTSATIRVDHFGYDVGWGKISNMFIGNKGLFYCATTSSITSILNNDTEDKVTYGVLPIPKYDEAQEKYYNGINVYQSTVMAVPTTNIENYEATIYLMEALGFYSKNMSSGSVTEAYYDTTLKLQAVDSQDDEDMLDIVFNNRLYDIGAIYDWGGKLLGIYSAVMRSNSNTLISSFEAIKDGAEAAMEQTLEDYKNIQT